jgi:hypothetical protein
MIVMSKSLLLESIQNGYSLFKELLAEIDPEQMSEPGAVGKWSVKDTVAHIVVHEQRMIQWMKERLVGNHPATPQPYAMPDKELNELNEQIYEENRNRSLEEMMRDLNKSHAEVLVLVKTSTEEDLLDSTRFQLEGGEPLWEAIAANTFSHYEEHGQDIRRWQAQYAPYGNSKF